MKQVILIRKDLKMRRGKEIAQGSHASMCFLIERIRRALPMAEGHSDSVSIPLSLSEREWIQAGMAKVCLQVQSETELLELHRQALGAGLTSHLIQDSGRTEFHGEPTITACAIGPDESSKIDAITGTLSLY